MISKFINKFVMEDKNIQTRSKIRMSLLAILFGIIVSSIFMLFLGHNPINILINVIRGPFKSKAQIYNFLILSGSFIISGLAISLSFKAGLFNIGVSGQMLLAGSATMVIALKYQVSWVLLIFIAILIGAIAAGISGFLKAFFNVNEVVSTLLLNWVWFFIFRYLTNTSHDYMTSVGNSIPLAGSSLINGANIRTIITIILAIFTAISAWFLFSKTTFGFKLKMVGKNTNAAKYAGVNVKSKVIVSMFLSGALSGLLAFVVYFIKDQQLKLPKSIALPSIGFDGIAISLLAFNNPVGIVLVSLFWGILNIGGQFAASVNPVLKSQVVQMIIGIIIYFAAISSLFLKLKPFHLVKSWYLNIHDRNIWNTRKSSWNILKEQNQSFKLKISELKVQHQKLDFALLATKKKDMQLKIKKLKADYSRKSNLTKDKSNKLNLFLSYEKQVTKLKSEFLQFKNDNNFNDLKNMVKEKKISNKIIFREHRAKIKKLIVIRNEKNSIGIYQAHRAKTLSLISEHEIKLSELKLLRNKTNKISVKNKIIAEKNKFSQKLKDANKIYKTNLLKSRKGGR